MFIRLSTRIVSTSNQTKCTLLSNQKCITQTTLINLHPNECSKELNYYTFTVKLDRRAESFNTLIDLSYKVGVPNKTEDLNIHVFNMITRKNESKILNKRYIMRM